MNNDFFVEDIAPILAAGVDWNISSAIKEVTDKLIALLPGDEWKKD